MRASIHLGILANEFFDDRVGRMGGFGWAARQTARLFQKRPELGVRVSFLGGEQVSGRMLSGTLHGAPFLSLRGPLRSTWRLLRQAHLDLLLAVDYRPNYRLPLVLLARTPAIVWARDPRTPEDAERIAGIRLPGDAERTPQGLETPDCTSFARLARLRRMAVVATCSSLAEKARRAYAAGRRPIRILPNMISLSGRVEKSPEPLVIFLGRLDPVKRPWMFVELARRFPEVRCVMLGGRHFDGPGAWMPENLPGNLTLKGFAEGEDKRRLLSAAWTLVNTSVHEGLAVSFLEALGHETPLLAGMDPDRVVSRFGVCVGQYSGDGLAGLPAYEAALNGLLADPAGRARLGQTGREWVAAQHSEERFLEEFARLCRDADRLTEGLAQWLNEP